MQYIFEIKLFFLATSWSYIWCHQCVFAESSVVKKKKKQACPVQWDFAGGYKQRAKHASFSTLWRNMDCPRRANKAAEMRHRWQPERSRTLTDTWAAQTTLHRCDLRGYFACPDRVCPQCFLQIKSPPIVFNCARLSYTQRRHHCRHFFFFFLVLFISSGEVERRGRAHVTSGAGSVGSDTSIRLRGLTAACATWCGASFCQWEPSLSLPWSSSGAASSRYSGRQASSRWGFSACLTLFDSLLAHHTYLPFLFAKLSLIALTPNSLLLTAF